VLTLSAMEKVVVVVVFF